MDISGILERARLEGWTDEEVVDRVRAGESALYEIIMRRYNQRLYRVARAIVRDDSEAEDIMQDAYVRAYENLGQFEGRAPFSAWLTRIAVHEALHRARKRGRLDQWDDSESDSNPAVYMDEASPNPEQATTRAELRELLEEAILELPAQYRAVLMLRDIEELSTSETADALGLTEENVKVRLHRGHGMVRTWLLSRVGTNAKAAFPFMGERCDRVVESVFAKIASLSAGHEIH
ncbi:MAG TPA: RNA polymerase sigma factor [Candidatus Methylomirabilis sp.]|nr:RNA polymerase sigma factor [Candidatus Methylomirabilis sp.]